MLFIQQLEGPVSAADECRYVSDLLRFGICNFMELPRRIPSKDDEVASTERLARGLHWTINHAERVYELIPKYSEAFCLGFAEAFGHSQIATLSGWTGSPTDGRLPSHHLAASWWLLSQVSSLMDVLELDGEWLSVQYTQDDLQQHINDSSFDDIRAWVAESKPLPPNGLVMLGLEAVHAVLATARLPETSFRELDDSSDFPRPRSETVNAIISCFQRGMTDIKQISDVAHCDPNYVHTVRSRYDHLISESSGNGRKRGKD